MKRIIILVLLAVICVSCMRKPVYTAEDGVVITEQDSLNRTIIRSDSNKKYIVEVIEGHEYLLRDTGYEGFMAHSGACPHKDHRY